MAPGVYADPEYLNSYELGWKQTVGGRLQMNRRCSSTTTRTSRRRCPCSCRARRTDLRHAVPESGRGSEGRGSRDGVVADRSHATVRERLVCRFGDHARLLLPGHDGSGRGSAGCAGRGPGRCADAGRQLAAQFAGSEVHGWRELHLELDAGRADVGRHVFVHGRPAVERVLEPDRHRAVERDRGLPHPVERCAEPLHGHRLRQERLRRGGLHPLDRLIADGGGLA